MTSGLRLGIHYIDWTVRGLVGCVVLWTLFSLLAGYRPFTVLTGSMEPTLAPGDVVVVKEMSPLDARIGGIVTFSDPEATGKTITHRVRSIKARGSKIDFQTEGDANNAVEHWTVARGDKIGKVTGRIPLVGHALVFLTGGTVRVLLLGVPLMLVAAAGLWRIWRPRASVVDRSKADATC